MHVGLIWSSVTFLPFRAYSRRFLYVLRVFFSCCPSDSLPDLRRSWDNLMWNLEIDDDDLDSEKQMKAAMDGVLASLVEVSICL